MSIKGFQINGTTQKYDYNALDNKPTIPAGAVVDAAFSTTSTNAVQNKVITERLDTMDDAIEAASQSGGSGVTEDVKQALLQLAQKVTYVDAGGQNYYQDLYDALYPSAVLTSITAAYTQSGTVYTSDTLDSLKPDLTVTAHYDDGSSETVTNYTLSGNLTVGTSVVTATYRGKTATFNVAVTRVSGTYSISNNLTGCSNSNAATTAAENASYSGTITADSGYTLAGATVSITMGGSSVTGYYSSGTISIPNVTGDVVITVRAVAVVLSSISAVFTQGDNIIYDTDSLDTLKQYLVVTATYSDSSTSTVPSADYTLSGTLEAGTSTITVSYQGKTTTFNATVTHYDIGWEDGVPYEFEWIDGKSIEATTGEEKDASDMSVTPFLPCDTLRAVEFGTGVYINYGIWYYDANQEYIGRVLNNSSQMLPTYYNSKYMRLVKRLATTTNLDITPRVLPILSQGVVPTAGTTYNLDMKFGKAVWNNTGEEKDTGTDRACSDFALCYGFATIKLSRKVRAWVGFYDGNKEYLSYALTSATGDTVEIPSDAVYFRYDPTSYSYEWPYVVLGVS